MLTNGKYLNLLRYEDVILVSYAVKELQKVFININEESPKVV